jgi:hypothetical protein
MHEIGATIPPGWVSEAARLAHAAGVEAVTVTEVFVHGPGEKRSVVSVETSTPKARAFVDSLLASPTFSRTEYTLTSREVRAIVSKEPVGQVTQPMSEPFPDVIQDLWQLSHLTPSYLGRAAGGAALLATGVIEDSPIAIVVAARPGGQLWPVEPRSRVDASRPAGYSGKRRASAGGRCGRSLHRRRSHTF